MRVVIYEAQTDAMPFSLPESMKLLPLPIRGEQDRCFHIQDKTI